MTQIMARSDPDAPLDHHPDDAFRSAIANGAPQHHWPFGDMAPVEGLSDDEVEAVIAFIRSEQQRLGFEQ